MTAHNNLEVSHCCNRLKPPKCSDQFFFTTLLAVFETHLEKQFRSSPLHSVENKPALHFMFLQRRFNYVLNIWGRLMTGDTTNQIQQIMDMALNTMSILLGARSWLQRGKIVFFVETLEPPSQKSSLFSMVVFFKKVNKAECKPDQNVTWLFFEGLKKIVG